MKTIALSRGKFALVDDADYDWLTQRGTWYAVQGNDTHFYAVRNVPVGNHQRAEKMHRVILGLTDPRIKTDHQDGDSLNNQRHNIRVATSTQNNQNAAKRVDNTSGIRGVRKEKARWRADIQVAGKRIFLGYYPTRTTAKQARRDAELRHHKEFSTILSRGESSGLQS